MKEIFHGACRHMVRRFARTALTVGGIAVGVLMVTLVYIIGQAGTQTVGRELENMGLQGVSVAAVSDEAVLTAEELQTVRAVAGVSEAMPLAVASGRGMLGRHSFTAYVGGIDAGADQVIALEAAHGRLLRAGDIRAASAVCVVDEAVALEAYGRTNAVGKTLTLTLDGTPMELTVVGVAKAGSSLLQSVSGMIAGLVYLPYTTLQAASGREVFDQIAVKVAKETETDAVRERVVAALDRESGTQGAYTAENLAAQRERLGRLMDIVGLILTAVSAVSLVVAGMGMLTSMLTAVNERVREIGIKQALGAGGRRILTEFLAESLLLAAVGGAVGMVGGALAGTVGLRLFGITASLPWTRLLPIWLGTVSLGGLFGWYPARKAARLHPVEALRQEVG
ncbi:MAG: FtsX-like permease family protein [Ruminococcaceae bacterium]|nr:FtsX-like permease family protein [Oscillospiraceae bacterium]